MYWVDFLLVLRRRWLVLLPCLLATGLLTIGVIAVVPTSYSTTASVMLLPATGGPPVGADQTDSPNAFNALPLTSVASLLAQTLAGSTVASRLQSEGLQGDYIAAPRTDGSAVVELWSSDAQPARASERVQRLVELAGEQLRNWQAVSAPGSRITVRTLIPPDKAVPSHGSSIRAMIVAAVLGLGLSVGLTFALDAFLLRRGRRDDARDEQARPAVEVRA